jgi:hypothetical protein
VSIRDHSIDWKGNSEALAAGFSPVRLDRRRMATTPLREPVETPHYDSGQTLMSAIADIYKLAASVNPDRDEPFPVKRLER